MYQSRTKTLSFHKKGDLYYLIFPSFDKTQKVRHCFSTRLGGISKGMFDSLNLGFSRGDEDSNVIKNYEILCNAIGIDTKRLVFSDQIHETKIRVVSQEDLEHLPLEIEGIDGLVTDAKQVSLVTLYADCVPLFFLDPVAKVIGLSHAGWRGTVGKIGLETIRAFKENFNSNPKDILVGIGPSIGKCCFEVDEPVAYEFDLAFKNAEGIIYSKPNNKYIIDLWEANKKALVEGGILESNITVTDLCTQCNKDVFFSHRGHKGKRGSLAAIIELI